MSDGKPPANSDNFAVVFILGFLAGASALFVLNAIAIVALASALHITNNAIVFVLGEVAAVAGGLYFGWRALKVPTRLGSFLLGCSVGLLGATSLCEMMVSNLGQH